MIKLQRYFCAPVLVLGFCLFIAFCAAAERTIPTTFFVDKEQGCDIADGQTAQKAWQTLERVNQNKLIPGDQVLFKRGCLWRGHLEPVSGSSHAPICYGAYGTGEKPALQGSVPADNPDQWSRVGANLWASNGSVPAQLNQVLDLTDSLWDVAISGQGSGRVRRACENNYWFNRFTCHSSGNNLNEIRLWGPLIRETEQHLLFRLRVRSTKPFKLGTVEITPKRSPNNQVLQGFVSETIITDQWQTVEVILTPLRSAPSGRLHLAIGSVIPSGAVFDYSPLGIWLLSQPEQWLLQAGVGNVIFNQGDSTGKRKSNRAALSEPGDFWFDFRTRQLFLWSTTNPALQYQSIELAISTTMVNLSRTHNIIFENLALRYGGGNCFSGSRTRNITIRNCDISWFGGTELGKTYRNPRSNAPRYYGSAIRFWNNAQDHQIISNRIWQIYDTAITHQGESNTALHSNLCFVANTIYQTGKSYEFQQLSHSARTMDISFTSNICLQAGNNWAAPLPPHYQSGHIILGTNHSSTTRFNIQHNTLLESATALIWYSHQWKEYPELDFNVYGAVNNRLINWHDKTHFTPSRFKEYQQQSRRDGNSSVITEAQAVEKWLDQWESNPRPQH